MTRRDAYTSRRHLIEQAAARGETVEQICINLGETVADVEKAMRRMDAAAAGTLVDDDPDDAPLDQILVQRLVRGDVQIPRYTRCPERIEAIRILGSRGLRDGEIGDLIGASAGTVATIRSRNSIPAAQPRDQDGHSWTDAVRASYRYRDRRAGSATG